MTDQTSHRKSVPWFLIGGILVAGVASLISIGVMISIAVERVQAGRGVETYRTHWLVEFNWIGFLVFVAITAVTLFVGLLFRLKEWREIRELQTKYEKKSHD